MTPDDPQARARDHRLPAEVPPHAPWREIALTWLAVILLLVAANVGARWYLDDFSSNVGYRLVREKWRLLLERTHPVDVLVLGDSAGNQGLMPDILAARFGGEALNLCTIGDALVVNDAWMLEAYLRRFGAPRRVVLVHVYDIWHREFGAVQPAVIAHIPLPLGFWSDLEPRIAVGAQAAVRIALNRYAPLHYEHLSLRTALRHPSKAFAHTLGLRPDGFMPVLGSSDQVDRDAAGHRAFVRAAKPRISALNRRALLHIAALTERHDFAVYIVNAPLYKDLAQEPLMRNYLRDLAAEIEGLLAPYPRAHYLFGEPLTFPAEVMQTVDHVDPHAAMVYSERVTAEIAATEARAQSGPDSRQRWPSH